MLKKSIIPILAVVFVLLCTVNTHAASATYRSTANGDSKQVTYVLTATATRTGERTARVNWTVTPSWTNGGESTHSGSTSYPTTITITVSCGNQSTSATIKSAGSNTLYSKSGVFSIAVDPKASSVNVYLKASGAGNYYTWYTETESWYTSYTTHYYAVYAYAWRPGDHHKGWQYCCNSGSHYRSGASNSYSTSYTYHEREYTVTVSHPTNSGTMGNQVLNVPGMEKYYYVTYDSVGGSSPPAKQGFIGGNSVKISKAFPTYRYSDAKLTVTAKGWSRTRSTPGTGTVNYTGGETYNTRADMVLYAVYPQRYYVEYDALGGTPVPAKQWFIEDNSISISGTTPKYWDNIIKKYAYTLKGWTTVAKTDPAAGAIQYRAGDIYKKNQSMKLYAVADPNWVGKVVYNKNCDDAAYNMPASQDKYYNVPITLSNNIPWREDVANKGQRRIFKYWNTKPDGTGQTFFAGDTFNLNANLDEPVPQDKINLYAIWYDSELDVGGATEEESLDQSSPRIRYIEKGQENTLTKDSKWRSGERQTQLEESLDKEGQPDARRSYDYEGNLIKENN